MLAQKVPLLDLKAQYAPIRSDVLQAMTRVCDTQHFILGAEVEALERELEAFLEVPHAIGVSSGTDALLAALMALGVGANDEVITSPFSFFASAGSIARLGARPVFVDIDPRTYNIDHALLGSALTARTKAIVPVHLFGQSAEMAPILEIATPGRHSRRGRRRAGDWRPVSRSADRWHRHDRMLFVLSDEKSRRVRRRRAGDDARRGTRSQASRDPAARRRSEISSRDARRELQARCVTGGHSASQAAALAELDGCAADGTPNDMRRCSPGRA